MQTAFALTTGCGGNRVFSSHKVTGKCEPDHILAEIKVFEFTITMTAREQRRRVLYKCLKAISFTSNEVPEIRRSHEQNFSMYVGCLTDHPNWRMQTSLILIMHLSYLCIIEFVADYRSAAVTSQAIVIPITFLPR